MASENNGVIMAQSQPVSNKKNIIIQRKKQQMKAMIMA